MNTTEHKQGKEKLHESLKKFHYFFRTSQRGAWALDKDCYTTLINLITVEMVGLVVIEKKGKHLFLFIKEPCINLPKQKVERCKKGIENQYESEFIKKDGEVSKFFILPKKEMNNS